MDRSESFKNWLIDLTPEKIDLLMELEKSCRLLAHVKELTGIKDDKLFAKMVEASKTLKDCYSDVVYEKDKAQ